MGRRVKITEEIDDGPLVAVQLLSNVELIKILQHHDNDALTDMIEEELLRRKTDGAPPQ
jgi:hypothetical protein